MCENDLFLLCSDGIYALYSDSEMVSMILGLQQQLGNLQLVSERLVEMAAESSEAVDNITVVLMRNPLNNERKTWKQRFVSVFKS